MSDESPVLATTSPEGEATAQQDPQAQAATPTPQERAAAVLAELSRLGVEKPQEVLQTASQYGRVSNQLGEAYRRIQQLESQLASTAKPQATQQQFGSEGGTIDLAALISSEAEKASERATRRVVGEIYQMQARLANDYNQVQYDEDFGLVKDAWEQALRTPEFTAALQSGQLSIPMAYTKLKERVLKTKMREMADILKQFTSPGQTTPPHVESGQTRSVPLPSDTDETAAKLKKIDEARRSGRMGSDKALEAIFDTISPRSDPIWDVSTAPRKKR